MTSSRKRICVFNCEDSLAWNPITFADMFIKGLNLTDSVDWFVCKVASEDFILEDILSFDGLIITGSHYNCRDSNKLSWFGPLCEVVREVATRGFPRLYAGCFGCQLVGVALNGVVDHNPDNVFLLKAENIVFHNKRFFSKYPTFLVDEIVLEKWATIGANIIVSHGDCVQKLPPNAKNLASSSSCKNEAFVCGINDNILAVQCHPEFDYEYAIQEKIWPSVVNVRKKISEEQAESYMKTFQTFTGEDSRLFLQFIAAFLIQA
jgi:GMP synthase-like glutamine amidotransferase